MVRTNCALREFQPVPTIQGEPELQSARIKLGRLTERDPQLPESFNTSPLARKGRCCETPNTWSLALCIPQSLLKHGIIEMTLRFQVLSLYKQLIRVAQDAKAPTGQQSYTEQIKAEFRRHLLETSEEVINGLIAKGKSKLGFLQVIAPRRNVTIASGKQHFVYRPGEGLIQTDIVKGRKTSFRDDRIDPDDLARHKRLLEYAPSPSPAPFYPFLVLFRSNLSSCD